MCSTSRWRRATSSRRGKRRLGGERSRAPKPVPQASREGETLVPAGPATRRLARELGVDLAQVRGTASGGRVTQEDIKAHVRQLASGTTARGSGLQVPSLPDFEKWGTIERRP